MARLLALREWLQRQRYFRFYKTSLLLLWCPAPLGPSSVSNEPTEGRDAECRWVDFAYALPAGQQNQKGGDLCCNTCCTCGAAAPPADDQKHRGPPLSGSASAPRDAAAPPKGGVSCCVLRANEGLLAGVESLLVLLRAVLWGGLPNTDMPYSMQGVPMGATALSLSLSL